MVKLRQRAGVGGACSAGSARRHEGAGYCCSGAAHTWAPDPIAWTGGIAGRPQPSRRAPSPPGPRCNSLRFHRGGTRTDGATRVAWMRGKPACTLNGKTRLISFTSISFRVSPPRRIDASGLAGLGVAQRHAHTPAHAPRGFLTHCRRPIKVLDPHGQHLLDGGGAKTRFRSNRSAPAQELRCQPPHASSKRRLRLP